MLRPEHSEPSLGERATYVPGLESRTEVVRPNVAASVTPRVSIVLATLNERDALPSLLRCIDDLHLPSHEIIVVDDGSTDGTREYVREVSASNPSIQLIAHDGRRTLGPAQSEGVRGTRGEYVVVMDSDMQHPPDVIPRLISELDAGASLAVASRYCDGGSAGRRPRLRSVISRSAEVIAKALLPEARVVRDPLSGFFAVRRTFVNCKELPAKGYKLLLPLLVSLRGGRIVEIPYLFRDRRVGNSKITSSIRFVPIFLSEILIARRYHTRLARAAHREAGWTDLSAGSDGL